MTLAKNAFIPPGRSSRAGREALGTALERGILAPMMWGRTDAGSSRPIGQEEWLVQAGNVATTTNGSGVASVTYPKAFPKGTLAVVYASDMNAQTSLDPATLPTASGWTFKSTAINTAVNIYWIAIGY